MPNPRVALDIACQNEPWGTITLELDEEGTPETAGNFLQYVEEGYYNGTIFHRVISHFMIQGGGYTPDHALKAEGLRAPIRNEAAAGGRNQIGTVAMARTSDPHSATCQFFINAADNGFLDHPGQDGWGYCVFGRVVDGMDVVDRIREADVTANPGMGEKSRPVHPPVISQARRI